MSDFNPQINESNHGQTGYGRIFCNYPQRRADYAINNGVESYQFSDVRDTHMPQSMDPRPKVRDEGILNEYSEGSPIQPFSGFSTPYAYENKVQDRIIGLNRDIVATKLASAPSQSKKKTVKTTMSDMPKVAMPNPRIPVYNHLIPYEYVSKFGQKPCDSHRFQSVEHVWSNGTRVKGFDPRLEKVSKAQYNRAVKSGRQFPRLNVHQCKDV